MLDELISKYYTLEEAEDAWAELESGANLRGVFVMHELAELAAKSASGRGTARVSAAAGGAKACL